MKKYFLILTLMVAFVGNAVFSAGTLASKKKKAAPPPAMVEAASPVSHDNLLGVGVGFPMLPTNGETALGFGFSFVLIGAVAELYEGAGAACRS